jgi:hypothetical protein
MSRACMAKTQYMRQALHPRFIVSPRHRRNSAEYPPLNTSQALPSSKSHPQSGVPYPSDTSQLTATNGQLKARIIATVRIGLPQKIIYTRRIPAVRATR